MCLNYLLIKISKNKIKANKKKNNKNLQSNSHSKIEKNYIKMKLCKLWTKQSVILGIWVILTR